MRRGILIAALLLGAAALAFKTQRDDPRSSDRALKPPPPAAPRQAPGYASRGEREVGRITLPSGRVTVGDYMIVDQEPLPHKLPRGPHPVMVTLAGNEKNGDTRAAMVTLVAGPEKPVKWEQRGGMGTDGGMGFIAAAETADAGTKLSPEEWDRRGAQEIETLESPSKAGQLDGPDGLPYVVYATGFGDGGYPIWIGRDARGQVARIRVDFGILDWRRTR